MLNKIGHKPSGGQTVKSHKKSVFIMLSCWISSSNANSFRFSVELMVLRHIYILYKFTCNLQFHHTRLQNALQSMLCDYPFDNNSILEINLTKEKSFKHCLNQFQQS